MEDEPPTAPEPSPAGQQWMTRDIIERELPEEDRVFRVKTRHREVTRRHLALGLLIILGIMALSGQGAYIAGLLTADEFRDLSTLFTPVVTLAGAAFGFFFGRESAER
ncbi:MAG: hypothetical protein AB1486_34720 [Planctomycetota bacterium]